jgi:hypothetical protein
MKKQTMKKSVTGRLLPALLALALALALSLGSVASVFALGPNGAVIGSEQNPVEAGLTKILQVPEGTVAPASLNFRFVVTPVSFENSTAPAIVNAMPTVVPIELSFTKQEVEQALPDSYHIKTLVKEPTTSIFKTIQFNAAGVYVYEIAEARPTNTLIDPRETLTYSPARYRLNVYVKKKLSGEGYYVEAIGAVVITKDKDGQTVGAKVDPTPGGDTINYTYSQMTFTNNYYKKNDGDPKQPDRSTLRISKVVSGNGDSSKYFQFSVSVTKPLIVTAPAFYKAYVLEDDNVVTSDKNGTIAGNDSYGAYITLPSSGAATTMYLKHGQRLVSADTHVGAYYYAIEMATPGYKPEVHLLVDGMNFKKTGSVNTALSTGENVLGETGINTATFVNTYEYATPTGVIINNLPYIVLMALAAGAFALYLAAKRRRRRRVMAVEQQQ